MTHKPDERGVVGTVNKLPVEKMFTTRQADYSDLRVISLIQQHTQRNLVFPRLLHDACHRNRKRQTMICALASLSGMRVHGYRPVCRSSIAVGDIMLSVRRFGRVPYHL